MREGKKHTGGHAVALYSGGLDSALAILLVLRQNMKVTALTFSHDFSCVDNNRSNPGVDPVEVGKKYGFDVIPLKLGSEFVEIVKRPRHGYGKNLNPCVDCRILMLKKAREYMEKLDADFIITGEVIGQRPKSQMRNSINLVDKQTGLKGLLVRPLSALLMDETIPEQKGLLDRSKLEAISGRSRKRQLELAGKLGLEDFGAPAGGCLLTDPNYCRRLKDIWEHNEKPEIHEISLLRFGRHFRLDEKTKVVVGRDESDNDNIEKYSGPNCLKLEALGTGSPITLLMGDRKDENVKIAASLTARYCDSRKDKEVIVTCTDGADKNKSNQIVVEPRDFKEFLI